MAENVLFTKTYMENFFVPTLHNILKNASPEKYAIYGGNACRQTAILGYFYMKELLPQYEWEVWEGLFDDNINGRDVSYEHAWLYGKSNSKKKKDLLVDLAIKKHERLFMETRKNQYPSDHPEYKNMVVVKKKRMNPNKEIKAPEFFTSMKGEELLQMLRAELPDVVFS